MPVDKKVTEMTVGRGTLAALFNLSENRVHAMTVEGILHHSARGRWKLIDSIHCYVAYLREEQRNKTKGASETRVRDARASEIELRMARIDRDIVPLEEALATIDDVTGDYLQSISSLPARITREQNERHRIEAICDAERSRVADGILQKASALRTGVPFAEADAEDDA